MRSYRQAEGYEIANIPRCVGAPSPRHRHAVPGAENGSIAIASVRRTVSHLPKHAPYKPDAPVFDEYDRFSDNLKIKFIKYFQNTYKKREI
jgi:hypothetical protein